MGNALIANATDVNVADILKENATPDNAIKGITELKENFQRCVNATLEKSGKKKLAIFVDDLDRLPPMRAVEILEVLKLFLDCENCVYVLAIDYDVVCRGIGQKYGEDFDQRKGRSFFDKIIQVPFKMPIANYEIRKYVAAALVQMGFTPANIDVYINLISLSIGYNPRGLKRIFNAYLLLKMIYKDMSFDTPQIQAMLFAVLCLQMSYEDIYNYFVLNETDIITAELLMSLTDTEQSGYPDDVNTFFEEIGQLNIDNDKEEIKEFMGAFCAAIKNENGEITENDMELLGKVLRISGTASASIKNHVVGNGKIGKGVRYSNELDAEFSYRSIGEFIEKSNAPSGWNGCKLDGYRLFGIETKESNFSTAVVNILSELYKKIRKDLWMLNTKVASMD